MARFGHHWIDDVIACIIRDEIRRVNGPEYIALGITGAESNWDPNIIGDHGKSFGLYQLYVDGGQGDPYRDNPEALLNPRLNAQVGSPPVATAYKGCRYLGAGGIDLIACTAIGSGHPGRVAVSDPRIQRIIRITLEVVFNPDGTWARWPEFRARVCAGEVVPPEPPPAPPEPVPDWSDLEPVEPPTRAEPGVATLEPVEPPASI